LLHFGFAYVPHAPGQTLSIVAENLRVLLPFFAMAVLVQARRVCRTAHGRRTFRCYCDLVVTVLVANDLVLPMGRSVGAYGRRMVLSMLPAGPIELAAYALATSVYLRSRRSSIGGREAPGMTRVAALSAGALLIAALIETYAT
jgi:hypothetical protein